MGRPNHIDEMQEDEIQTPGWGSRLKELRQARSLTMENVARETLLELKLIAAIEAEDLDKLPGCSFVKGYLRSYAKFLEIDHESIIKAFESVCDDQTPAIKSVVKVRPEVSSNSQLPKALTWTLAIAVFVSALFWWWSTVLAPVATESETTLPPVLEFEPLNEPIAPAISDESISDVRPEPDAELEAPPSIPSVEPETITPVAETETLAMRFSEDSWVEVYNTAGDRLFIDMVRAGESRQVQSENGFNVLLGNAPGAVVEYNGETVDLTPYIERSNRARFTLGE